MKICHDNYLDYINEDFDSELIMSRKATEILCDVLSKYNRQIIGLEGGVYWDGKFQTRIDWILSRRLSAHNEYEAKKINLGVLKSIYDDPSECNSYMVVSKKYNNTE